MKIEELQDHLDSISLDMHSLRNKVLILDSFLEEVTVEGFNENVCKSMLEEIDKLFTLKYTIFNRRIDFERR